MEVLIPPLFQIAALRIDQTHKICALITINAIHRRLLSQKLKNRSFQNLYSHPSSNRGSPWTGPWRVRRALRLTVTMER